MAFKVSVLLPSIGPLEVLPTDACPHDVLEEGHVYSSKLPGKRQLFWSASSYLNSQGNAYGSAVSGQPVRGDAVLVAEHSTAAAAQTWLHQVASSLCSLSESSLTPAAKSQLPVRAKRTPMEEASGRQHAPPLDTATRDSFMPAPHSMPTSPDFHTFREGPVRPAADRGTAVQPAKQLSSTEASDDTCEPRTKLLWRIVGQATSASWKDAKAKSVPVAEPSNRTLAPLSASLDLAISAHNPDSSGGAPEVYSATCAVEALPTAKIAALSRSGLEPKSSAMWADLQEELITMIAGRTASAGAAQAMVSVCRFCSIRSAELSFLNGSIKDGILPGQWRTAILSDEVNLRQIPFRPPRSTLPLVKKYTIGVACPAATGLPVTVLTDKAAKAGNIGACLAVANFLDTLGMREDGMRYWKRAAKLGDPRAQVAFGTAAYAGTFGVVRDGDEAYRFLSKAASRLAQMPPTSPTGALLAKAALHLGFLALDGEATRMDLEVAVSWFRLASKCGSRDAESALGTLLRTGQYGPS